MSLWNAQDAAAATGGRAQGNWTASGVSIDTRNMAPGDLFIALKDTRDGHEFVQRALQQGAAAAMVSRIPEGVAADGHSVDAEHSDEGRAWSQASASRGRECRPG